MAQKKVLLMVKVTVDFALLDEFNKLWGEEYLPYWGNHGARHIGSYINLVGGPSNEIVRIFEFENISSWLTFHEWLFHDKLEGAGKEETRPSKPTQYVTGFEEKLLVSVY